MHTPDPTFQVTLQQVRKTRRFSQLELSLRLGVSQRHVSFVESGRARPSRELLLAWLQELDTPLAVRNRVMLQAGYAPAYSATPLDDPALAQANAALLQLLEVHEPMPAMVIDAHWNVLHFNKGAQWLLTTLLPWVAQLPAGAPLHMLDLLAHPEGLARHMLNLSEKGPAMLAQLREEASALPALAPRLAALTAALEGTTGRPGLVCGAVQPAAPVLTTRFASPYGELAFFSMFSTFGTPQDITLASLRVEHLFAADAATAALLRAHVA